MASGKWLWTPSGSLLALDRIELIAVIKHEDRFAVAGWTAGDGNDAYGILFAHPDRAICEEWLQEFTRRHLQVAEPILFRRLCPECGGLVCDYCDGDGIILVDPAEIPAKGAKA